MARTANPGPEGGEAGIEATTTCLALSQSGSPLQHRLCVQGGPHHHHRHADKVTGMLGDVLGRIRVRESMSRVGLRRTRRFCGLGHHHDEKNTKNPTTWLTDFVELTNFVRRSRGRALI